ncbi:MAG: sensor histidine kinase, partial [Aeromonas sp.]
MALPSLRRRLMLALTAAGTALLLAISALLVVAEEQIEMISLQHWLHAEVSRYNDDWLRLGAAAPAPSPRNFSSYWSEQGYVPAWLDDYREAGFYEHHLGEEDKHLLVQAHPSGQGLIYLVFNDDADDYLDPYEDR